MNADRLWHLVFGIIFATCSTPWLITGVRMFATGRPAKTTTPRRTKTGSQDVAVDAVLRIFLGAGLLLMSLNQVLGATNVALAGVGLALIVFGLILSSSRTRYRRRHPDTDISEAQPVGVERIHPE